MINYNIYNPNGNITILASDFVEEKDRPSVALELMKKESTAEQVGFVSTGDGEFDIALNMAGGEFCGNATLCTGVFYCEQTGKTDNIKVKVSGCSEILTVSVEKTENGYISSTDMPVPVGYETKNLFFENKNYAVPFVDLGGISHLIADFDFSKEQACIAVKKWCSELKCDALGVMLFDEKNSSIIPIVYVPKADTLFIENSCASGTTAVGYYLAKKYNKDICADIFQPGGMLNIKASPCGKLYLTGSVIKEK